MTGHATTTRVQIAQTSPVVMSSWYQRTPTIHRLVFHHDMARDRGPACGAPTHPTSPILRFDHAQQIGKKCRRCFP